MELFWGVFDSRSMSDYRANIAGEWLAIPRMLSLFTRYEISATWATVGMLMCRDYSQWHDLRPTYLPTYLKPKCNPYLMDIEVRDNPTLFFARPLIDQILATQRQEIASHSYSHFYCGEPGATPLQFRADLEFARLIGEEVGVKYKSFVFPRNQIAGDYLAELKNAGYLSFRGNPNYWLYRDGHFVPGGYAGRAIRLIDAYLPISGNQLTAVSNVQDLVNIPATLSLRPWSHKLSLLESLRLMRLKRAMSFAAESDSIFHLWWHPHNFGLNLGENLAVLDALLQHYVSLRDKYGMRSLTMNDIATGDVL
jgi:peptidoglycan/xylan/chitin deacetylase (PgdA/CDA1 family)